MRIRLLFKERYKLILRAAIQLSEEIGYWAITRDAVANRSDVCSSNVSRYFPTMNHLKDAVVRHGIKSFNTTIIDQARVAKHKFTKRIKGEK